ncbi:MAG: 50S ribosomal protein L22 [Armatimonadetes bacterium]|nr:50S ribosomal protein L22 [Armatimonadota bacterium]
MAKADENNNQAEEAEAPATPEGAAAARKKAKSGKPKATEEAAAEPAKAVKASKAAKAEKAPAAPAKAPKKAAKKAADAEESAGREARAHAKYVRMAPRKLRLVMDAIRGKAVGDARSILQFCGKRAAGPLTKVLNSAVANAENNHQMDAGNLVIARAWVDQGPSIKSFIPRARGRASAVHKFMSHITIVVKEREEV